MKQTPARRAFIFTAGPLLATFDDAETLYLARLLSTARDAMVEDGPRADLWVLLMGLARGGVLLLLEPERRLLVRLVERAEGQAALLGEDLPEEHRVLMYRLFSKLGGRQL